MLSLPFTADILSHDFNGRSICISARFQLSQYCCDTLIDNAFDFFWTLSSCACASERRQGSNSTLFEKSRIRTSSSILKSSSELLRMFFIEWNFWRVQSRKCSSESGTFGECSPLSCRLAYSVSLMDTYPVADRSVLCEFVLLATRVRKEPFSTQSQEQQASDA